MSTPRRRLIRPAAEPPPALAPRSRVNIPRLRDRLEHDRAALTRWMARLRRAFNAATKLQRSITRIEKQLRRMEDQ